jgi:hypothetical protein
MHFLGNVFRQSSHGPAGPPKVMKNGEGEQTEAGISCPTQRIGWPILRVCAKGGISRTCGEGPRSEEPRHPTLRKEREGWVGYRVKSRCFTRGSRMGHPTLCLGQEIPGVRQFVFRQSGAICGPTVLSWKCFRQPLQPNTASITDRTQNTMVRV